MMNKFKIDSLVEYELPINSDDPQITTEFKLGSQLTEDEILWLREKWVREYFTTITSKLEHVVFKISLKEKAMGKRHLYKLYNLLPDPMVLMFNKTKVLITIEYVKDLEPYTIDVVEQERSELDVIPDDYTQLGSFFTSLNKQLCEFAIPSDYHNPSEGYGFIDSFAKVQINISQLTFSRFTEMWSGQYSNFINKYKPIDKYLFVVDNTVEDYKFKLKLKPFDKNGKLDYVKMFLMNKINSVVNNPNRKANRVEYQLIPVSTDYLKTVETNNFDLSPIEWVHIRFFTDDYQRKIVNDLQLYFNNLGFSFEVVHTPLTVEWFFNHTLKIE